MGGDLALNLRRTLLIVARRTAPMAIGPGCVRSSWGVPLLKDGEHAGAKPGRMQAQSVAFDLQVIARLHVQPELRRGAEVPAESQRRVGRDPTLAVHDLIDTARRHGQIVGQPVLRERQRLKELRGHGGRHHSSADDQWRCGFQRAGARLGVVSERVPTGVFRTRGRTFEDRSHRREQRWWSEDALRSDTKLLRYGLDTVCGIIHADCVGSGLRMLDPVTGAVAVASSDRQAGVLNPVGANDGRQIAVYTMSQVDGQSGLWIVELGKAAR